MKNRLVIFNFGYDPCSGGVKVLHYLTALLDAAGIPVASTHPCFFVPRPIIPVVGKCEKEDIAVYPDVVEGNPLGANRVVRYLLYFARYRVAVNECPIIYMPAFVEGCRSWCDGKIADDAIVEIPNVEDGDWCFPETKTIENVLFTGKHHCSEPPAVPCTDMPSMADPDRWRLRYWTLAFLRKATNFYTQDHHTVMEHEAALCGCKVFKVYGAKDCREQHPDAQARIMRPSKDRDLAVKFSGLVQRFFNL